MLTFRITDGVPNVVYGRDDELVWVDPAKTRRA